MRTTLASALILLLLPLFASPALAAGIDGLSITAGIEGGPTMTITDVMIQAEIDAGNIQLTNNASGSITLTGGNWTMPGMWSLAMDSLTFDPDPVVSLVGGLTNLSGVAQDFFISSTIPVIPIGPTTLIGGSTVLTYADANFDGAGGLTNATGPVSGYAGAIDGAEVLNLLAAFALAPAFAGDATQSVSETAGLPGPSLPGPAANTTISVTNRFNLSANDQATYNTTFIVEPIPEPGTAGLLGVGLAWLAVAGRRRA